MKVSIQYNDLAAKFIDLQNELERHIEDISDSYFGIMSDGKTAVLNISRIHYDLLRTQHHCDIDFIENPYGKLVINVGLSDDQMPVITPLKDDWYRKSLINE